MRPSQQEEGLAAVCTVELNISWQYMGDCLLDCVPFVSVFIQVQRVSKISNLFALNEPRPKSIPSSFTSNRNYLYGS